ncbi:MAG: hypothetical protein IJH81_05400 [Lachnospiraceae bacterium]|nr:hypothetical protein [Lachnospiraceae bacterium]
MLTKLIGYEMKAFGRIILPLYAATIGMALIMGLSFRVMNDDVYSNLWGAVVIMIFTTLILATMVMTGVLCVQRFYRNLLGNEGYLMFSLPVGTHQLILAKVLGSLIWAILGGVAGVCTVLALGLTAVPLSETSDLFKRLILNMRLMPLDKILGTGAVWLLIVILGFVATLMQIYASLAIGHQWTEHRILGSVLAYFGINLVKNIVGGLLLQVGYHTGWTSIFMSQMERGDMSVWQVQLSIIVSSIVMIAIYSAATWFLLDRRINLE